VAAPVQQRATGEPDAPAAANEAGVHAAAAQGIATPSSRLPYSDTIQHLFGRHDVSSVQAHTGSEAAASAHAMGASAYATGDHVVLGGGTDLHTVAHEAAHVVQQRGGVQLKGGVGAAGDAYEQHADAVADRVVAGESAVPLLDQMSGGDHSSGAGGAVQRAPAMPASSDSADSSGGDPAAFARLQDLLMRAGLSVAQQQLPTANLLTADAARISNLLLQAQPSLVGLGPRMVAARLMQDVVSGGGPTSIAAVAQRLAAFAPLIVLRPDGYIAHAVTGEAIQRAGKTEVVNGELHAGGLVAGTFYYSNGGVFYRASDSLAPTGPPIGELGLEHDAVNSALDGAADALAGVAAGLYQLIRHPIDSIAALRQLPGAIAQLIENSPEYWELFRAKPLNDQIHDVSKLVTTLATMYGGAAGATTRIAAAAGDLGNVTIRALTLSGGGELAWATVSVPVGTVATALSGGPGAVYVLHMANSSLNNSGGGTGGGGPASGGGPSGGGRLIVPAGRTLSAEETAIANQLVAEGHTVEAVAESTVRTPDFLVDGVRTELKSISNLTSSDLSGALSRRIREGAGQASHIIVDVRQQAGMTEEVAQRAVIRAYGADKLGRIQSVRLIGQGFDVTVPYIPSPPPAIP
jgi:hypothetical protein